MSVTIRQIAEQAGVSRGTVDRVLNGRPGVKPNVRDRIKEIAAELNYVPNVAAKALAYNKKPVLFGIVMPPQEISFFEIVRQGIQAAADELKDLGIRLEYYYVNNQEPTEAIAAMDHLMKHRAAGIMLCAMDDPLIRVKINEAVEQGVPVITFNTDVEGSKRMCFVGQNLVKSGAIAAGLMSRVIPKNAEILILTGSKGFQAHRARVDGFTDWINQYGQAMRIMLVIEGFDHYETTLLRMKQALTQHPNISGIYLASGHVGASLEAVKQCGMEHQIRMVSNDVLPEQEQGMQEGIIDFTIVQDPFQQGYRSLRILYEYIFMGREPVSEFLYTETHIKILESL